MRTIDELAETLKGLDGRGYKAYKQIEGAYDAGTLTLHIEHAQGDPFAEPSRFRAEVPPDSARLPGWAFSTPTRRRASADFLNRRLAAAFDAAPNTGGSGKSGHLGILRPGQQVLQRASLSVRGDGSLTARLRVGLPARGRSILGAEAAVLVRHHLLSALEAALLAPTLDAEALRHHVETVEDSVSLRAQLRDRGLVAFVADGALLPRESGVDDHPLATGALPFESPEGLRVVLEAPNAGPVPGLGVPEGITLIVGGGYHGKSTLLRALERGIYDHVPGDGRERVVAVPSAVKVRAEDGRSVSGVDISNFISTLPSGEDTTRFFTRNASGSTSQAASIVEALEVGTTCLLLDEDTSATNFMIRDARMQALVEPPDEPITPFIDRARQLRDELGVSVILVVGGSGDYFDIADTIVTMREYRPREVTLEAKRIAERLPTRRKPEGGSLKEFRHRTAEPESVNARRGRRDPSIRIRSLDRVEFGTTLVDLGGVEQLVEEAQTRALAYAALRVREQHLEGVPLQEAAHAVVRQANEAGMAGLHPYGIGELAEFRPHELAAFLNRLRTLRLVSQETDGR